MKVRMIEKYRESPFNMLAAKYDGQELWLPYYMHLMDTAGVMERLVTHWLPAHITETITEENSEVDLDKLCRFIALVHDIGKATPIFQAKICDRAVYLRQRITASGISIQSVSSFSDSSKTPHSFAGEAILLRAG